MSARPRTACFFFFQAEDGIRADLVTGVQTCALPISRRSAADDVWAVGDSGSAGSLVEHWNGLIWTVVSHPEPTSGARTLWGVKALQPNDAWAAGYVNSPASGLQPMIQHWDGASWQLQSTAAPAGSWLTAVSGLPAGDLWTVGATGAATLTLRLDR